jgi:hypothetical protein
MTANAVAKPSVKLPAKERHALAELSKPVGQRDYSARDRVGMGHRHQAS